MLIISAKVNAQDLDTTFMSECRILQDKGLLQKAEIVIWRMIAAYMLFIRAAIISKQMGETRYVKKLSKRLLSKKYKSPTSYRLCADLYLDDSIKYIGIIKKGLKVFKNDTILLTHQTNHYLSYKDFNAALHSINELIKYKNNNNKSLYYARGYCYEVLQDYNNALKYYEKAIEIDPEYFNVHYNIATIHFNKAVDIISQANNEIDFKEYERLKGEGEKALAQSLPYLLKANKIKPNDLTVLEALKSIYNRLDKIEEYTEVKKRIDKLNVN